MLDVRRDDAARIDALEPHSGQIAGMGFEVPPRDAVLRADDHGVWSEEGTKRRRQSREGMRLDAQEHDVRRANRGEVSGDLRPHLPVPVRFTDHAQAVGLHGGQVRASCEEHDLGPGPGQLRPEVATDRPGAGDDDLHAGGVNASATTRRWILPVAVRGMVSVM